MHNGQEHSRHTKTKLDFLKFQIFPAQNSGIYSNIRFKKSRHHIKVLLKT